MNAYLKPDREGGLLAMLKIKTHLGGINLDGSRLRPRFMKGKDTIEQRQM